MTLAGVLQRAGTVLQSGIPLLPFWLSARNTDTNLPHRFTAGMRLRYLHAWFDLIKSGRPGRRGGYTQQNLFVRR